jgi:hypothetical protein
LIAPLFSPEFQLAAACSIWPPSDYRTQTIRKAASKVLDWDLFLRVVVRHGVIGLANDGLRQVNGGVPAPLLATIHTKAVALARRNLILAAEGLRLQLILSQAGVPVFFVKGVALGVLAYRNLAIRESKDLDLLVSPESFARAASLMEEAGYERFEPPITTNKKQLNRLRPLRKDFGYIHHNTQLQIELHWRLFLNPHFIAENLLIASSRIAPVAEATGLRTLDDEALFAYLCGHGALHWWHELKWLADVGALLASYSEDDVAHLYRAAEKYGVGRPAAQAILLCHRLLGANVPSHLVASLRKSASVRWLEATALHAMTAGSGAIAPSDLRFGTTRGSLSSFLLKSDSRYWLAELRIHLTSQADVLALNLPERLQFLHPFLRMPLWLWRHALQHPILTRRRRP